jgi:formylglycine-generating enzyme required for sulfatase activity
MRSPLAFMRVVARAALNAVGGGVAGDLAVSLLPEVARDVWKWWGKDKPREELRDAVEAVAQLPPAEAHQLAQEAVAAEGADKPEAARQTVAGYLEMIPLAVRQSLRRPEDPSGKTVSSSFTLNKADDVLGLLPPRAPRFKPGDRPAGIGDWMLEELLGIGGFGEVWRARNPHLANADPVALKFCLDAQAAQWLRHEAALLDRVRSQGTHPGIVRLQHTYLSAATPCLEYEYVPGGDLCGLIAQWRDSPPMQRLADSLRLMHELADIVAHAHRLDPPIVHRDLKPANILMQPAPGGSSRPRVADFGIGGVAARHAHQLTQRGGPTQGYFLGTVLRGSCTPLYASPQQMRGEDPDPRDDVHALGVIWFQLLTGDLSTGATADWRDEVEPLGAPEGMLRLLGACLSSRVERRPADAGVLVQELVELLPEEQRARSAQTVAGMPAATTQVVAPTPAPSRRPTPPHVRPAVPVPIHGRPRGPQPVPANLPRYLTNALGMKFVLVPAGTFLMGSPPSEQGRSTDEEPQHEVTINRPFYLGVYPVTQDQYHRLIGTNPSHFCRGGKGKDRVGDEDPRLLPVEKVTWGNAVAFCRKLSEMPEESRHNRLYRLPSEAEWEYACRAGKSGEPFHFGATLNATQGNFDGTQPYGRTSVGPYLKRPTAVGSYPPNDFGLFDMHGNVWEWCQDWYAEDYYAQSPADDPPGPESGQQRVLRGGCWSSSAANCRSAYRSRAEPGLHVYRFGFRVVLEVAG